MTSPSSNATPAFLRGGGELGRLIAAFPWERTAMGPMQAWPPHVRDSIALMLRSDVPMVALYGPEGVMVYNDAYSGFAGGRHPRLLGSPVREGWPEVADFNDNVMRVGLSGRTLHYEDQELTLYRKGEPEQVWMNLDYSPVLDEAGEPAAVLAIVVETTGKVLAERRLAAERTRLHQMFQQGPSFICTLAGPDHVFEFANEAYLKLFGRQVVGRSARDAFPDLQGQGFFEQLDRVYSTGEPFRADAALIDVAGVDGRPARRLYLNFIYQPLRDEQGRVSGIFCEGFDVTEQVRTEQALREANRRKDEFLAMLAHELRNPLAPIATASALISRAPRDEVAVQRMAEVLQRQVRHMSNLVDDLLDVSRVTRGLIEIERSAVDVRGVVQGALEQARPAMEARGHSISVKVPDGELWVVGDRTRLIQVLVNLLTNAAKYTPEGGTVAVRAAREGDRAVLEVRDSGNGIAPDLLPHVFDLFTQGERTPDRTQGGLGIGLALVKALVGLHGGEASAHSEGKGKGATFRIALPLAKGLPATGDAGQHARAPSLPPLRILVTDDNVDAAHSLASLLEMDGHSVHTCFDARHALEWAQHERPQVCVLDVGLPDMTGLELCSRLRQLPHLQDTLFIALTGYGQPQDREATAKAGFHHHLVKPVEPDALEALLRAWQR